MLLIYLVVFGGLFSAFEARRDIVVDGTTVGPDFVRRQGKLSPRCPASEPHPIENGKYCCKFYRSTLNDTTFLSYSSPRSDCRSYVKCLDEENSGHGCREVKFTDLTSCPREYPYAMNSGMTCCKFQGKKNSTSQCNGLIVERTDPRECCYDDQFVNCPDETIPCKDTCGKYPQFAQYGSTLFHTLPTTYKIGEMFAKCEELNAWLPMLRYLVEWEDVLEYFVEGGFTEVPSGIKVFPGKASSMCVDAACTPFYRYHHFDDPYVAFAYEPWMQGRLRLDLTLNAPRGCTKMNLVNNKFTLTKEMCASGPAPSFPGFCVGQCT